MPINPPKTSFIPKKSLSKDPKPRGGGSVHWFLALGLVVVLVTATSYGASFVYKAIMKKRIDSLAASLQRARDAFETNLITELQRVDARLQSSSRLLSEHVAVTPMFSLLEETTIQTVRFTNLDYFGGSAGGDHKIRMRGEARDFSSIALQSDIFSENRYIKNHIFSDLNLDSSDNVVFEFSADIDGSILSYQNFISDLSQQQP